MITDPVPVSFSSPILLSMITGLFVLTGYRPEYHIEDNTFDD